MEVKTESNHFETALRKIEDLTRENYRLRSENYRLEEQIRRFKDKQLQNNEAKPTTSGINMDEIFADADAAMKRVNEKSRKETAKYAKQK